MLIQEITEKVPLLSSQELLSLMEVIITSLKEKQNSEQQVSVTKLRQSKFIGCFDGDPDLAANSEVNFQKIMSEKYDPYL
ncbi:MAG: hypothetical protein HC916_14015 [Coleofasciculaceae cyanobacterium SM2_1_6]|nr:hypothetical protein [Coleofasciculaceae cyanobacterium SM2_1_6]